MGKIHHPHPSGIATGLTAGVVYIICAAAVEFWPKETMNFFNAWSHGIDLTKIAVTPQLTFGKFIVGLIGVLVAFYVIGFLYGIFYNLCYSHCKKRKWI